MSRKLQLLVMVLIVALPGACRLELSDSDNDSDNPFLRDTITNNDSVRFDITTRNAVGDEVAEFSPGEQIVIEYTITNLANKVQTVQLPHAGYPWLCIRNFGGRDCRWDSQHGKGFAQVVVPVEIEAFEEKVYTTAYDQRTNDNSSLGKGDFTVKALFGFSDNDRMMGTAWHNFAIE